jgi:cytochrome c-type biogenesis protein CcmE
MIFIGVVVGGVVLSAFLALRAFQENLQFFFSPSEIAAGEAPRDRTIRLGGMVVDGSIEREEGSLIVGFVITDYAHSVPVTYDESFDLLPDLFQEGQGVVVRGRVDGTGGFTAEQVLAKHDENYMPPEVAEALAAARESGDYKPEEVPPEVLETLQHTGDTLIP